MADMLGTPDFCSMVRSSGLGETWTHSEEAQKFNQFGWRCTTKESSYGNDTLIGNWNESRFDIKEMKKAKRLPSQFEHYFDTTYSKGYNSQPVSRVPEELKHRAGRDSHSFPGHQPELDTTKLKGIYNSWETTTRAAYVNPKVKTAPIGSGAAVSCSK